VRGHRDLRLAAAAALLCALVALLFPSEAVRLVFAAPLALFLPGYAIAAANFARRELDRPRLLLASLTLSLSALVVGALILNYVPGGIRALSWALLLLAIVFGFSRAAALRRPRAKAASRRPRLARPAPVALVLAGLGIAAMAAALVLAGRTVPADEALGYTELWVLPQGQGESGEFQVGVGSEEQQAVPYDLLVKAGERPLIRRSFMLDPGETKVVRLNTGATPGSAPVPVVATLLRQNQIDKIYRRVQNWIPAR
jgi:Protein of unknown function (DUF1616)